MASGSQGDGVRDEGVEIRKVSKDEAAFILGQGGKTKAKLCAVSGACIELLETRGPGGIISSQLQIRGTTRQRKSARKYIEFVIAQRLGPVKIDDPSAHDDLTILTVPADTVSFITGKQGSFLRLVEEEWSALLFFLQVNPKNPPVYVDPNQTERLAIFGPERRRRGAELKVMAAIEMKLPGYFTGGVVDRTSEEEGFATDHVLIKEEDYSYALGRSGSTRKKLARASSCIVEYVGRVAYLCGTKKERTCAREYLRWLLQQRVGETVHVDHQGRDDVTMIMVPSSCVGFVTGHRGASLRAIEEETNTFCFIEGTADDGEDQKPLLIFGCADDRRIAETLVWDKLSQKYDEVTGEYGGGPPGGKRGRGKGKGKDKDGGYKDGYDFGKGRGRGHYGKDSGKGGGETWVPREREADSSEAAERLARKDAGLDTVSITDDDAAFLMGPGGKTKKKIAAVSGAYLELKTNSLNIIGTKPERLRAKKYIQLVMAQRTGPVKLEDMDQHDDLSVVEVPAEAVSFVTGKQGSFLRLVEEEFGTLLFFIDFNKLNKRDQLERLAIFGAQRERRGAELKVMAAIEMKQPGYFTKRDALLPMEDPAEGFATDRMPIDEEDYSYALGKGGATRKKIARASGCVIEYIGRLAYLSGTKKERIRAREYLGWLFRQRVGPVEVDYACREDVTVLQVPKDCVGFVTGHKGMSLRIVEDATGTFCFIEGGRDDPHRDPKPLLIFGGAEARRQAEEMLRKRIDLKLVEGWVHEDGAGGGGGGGYQGYGGYNDSKGGGRTFGYDGKGADRRPVARQSFGLKGCGAGGKGVGANGDSEPRAGGSWAAPAGADVYAPPAVVQDESDDDSGAWGNWGGSSDEEDDDVPAGSGGVPPAGASAAGGAPPRPGGGPGSQAGQPPTSMAGAAAGWSRYPSGPYAGGAAAALAGASPHRGVGSGQPAPQTGYSPSRGAEEVALPPHLLHEEAWPDLGLGGPKKGRK